jgi:hypothetical protein
MGRGLVALRRGLRHLRAAGFGERRGEAAIGGALLARGRGRRRWRCDQALECVHPVGRSLHAGARKPGRPEASWSARERQGACQRIGGTGTAGLALGRHFPPPNPAALAAPDPEKAGTSLAPGRPTRVAQDGLPTAFATGRIARRGAGRTQTGA